MPTLKPRVTITFDQETYDAVKEFSALTGMSFSKTVSDMTSQSNEALRRTSALLKKAKNASAEVLQQIGEDMQKGADDITSLHDKAVSDLGQVLDSMDSQPPYINKGVRSNSKLRNISKHGASVVSGHFSGKTSK